MLESSSLNRLFKGDLGIKTVTAVVALVVLVGGRALGYISPEQFEVYVRLAEALGIYGLRDAMAKIKQ